MMIVMLSDSNDVDVLVDDSDWLMMKMVIVLTYIIDIFVYISDSL